MKKNKKSFLSRLFDSNIFLLILSFILSFTSWIIVSFVSDTNIKSVNVPNVPVTINLPDSDFDYTYFIDKYSGVSTNDNGVPLVSVDVKGNAIIVGSLKPDNITITGKLNIPDNAVLSPQEYKVTLNYEKTGSLTNYDVEAITPSTLTVFVDQPLEKEFDIVNSCSFKNDDKDKYANVTLSQSKIKVTGPESLINEIATVEVHGEITEEGTTKRDFIYKDKEGRTLEDYYLTPAVDSVDVTAKLLPIATVNLKVEYKNKPSGVKTQANVSPSAVRIAGEQSELDKYKNVLTLTTLDYADLKNENFKDEFTITPPDNCKIIPDENEKTAPTKATVSLDLSPYSDGSVSKKITYESDGYTYAFTPGEISVKLYGNEDEIKDITSDDIKMTVEIPDDFKEKLNELQTGQSVSRQGIKLQLSLSGDYTETWIYGSYTADQVTVTKK